MKEGEVEGKKSSGAGFGEATVTRGWDGGRGRRRK